MTGDTPSPVPETPEQEQFLAQLVAVLDAARDAGLDWRFVQRALERAWASHPGPHAWAPQDATVAPDAL